MTIEKRAGSSGTYYYRAERRGKKVIRTYVGRLSDPVVAVIQRCDRSQEALRRFNVQAERADDVHELDRLVHAYDTRFRAVINACITEGTDMTTRSNSLFCNPPQNDDVHQLPSQAEFHALVGRVEQGEIAAEVELRHTLGQYPKLWHTLGDVGQLLEDHLIGVIGGESKVRRWATKEFINKLRTDLLTGGDSPLEQFLIHRIVVSHLEVTIRTIRADMAITATSARRRERLLDSAIRRQKDAIRTLADFRREHTRAAT